MRIAILTNRFPPMLDGVGDYSSHLANELQHNGHKVSVICRREAPIQQAVRDGQFNVPVAATIPTWSWRAINPLRQFINEHQPDWILVQYVPNSFQQWAMPVWLPVLIWFIKRQGVCVSITFHEVSTRFKTWPLRYGIVSLIQRLLAWLLVRLANAVVTSIDYYARQLQAYTNKPIHLIPIGSNIIPVAITKNELTITRQQLMTNSGPIISTFGIRNQDILLQVFEQVVQQLEHVNLIIVGNLNLSASTYKIYQQLQHRIHVTGYLPREDVFRCLSASDVFFIPDPVTSKGEGGSSNKSGSLAAALAAGLPIIGTKGDMNNDLLREMPGVFLEDTDNLDLIKSCLLTLLSKDNTAIRQSNMHFFDQTFSWPAIVSRYSCILKPIQTK